MTSRVLNLAVALALSTAVLLPLAPLAAATSHPQPFPSPYCFVLIEGPDFQRWICIDTGSRCLVLERTYIKDQPPTERCLAKNPAGSADRAASFPSGPCTVERTVYGEGEEGRVTCAGIVVLDYFFGEGVAHPVCWVDVWGVRVLECGPEPSS
jgi:hypothetical protein